MVPAFAPPPVIITTLSLPNAVVGVPYSFAMAASGGVQPYAWSITSDTPDTGSWLNISTGGVLSGTPTTAETESLTVKVMDANGRSATHAYSLTVTAALSITTTSPLPGATVGTSYSVTMAATGGVPPYTWALLAASPDTGSWISLSTGGVLTGTPGTAETESLTIQVTDATAHSVSAPFSITVSAVGTTLSFPRVMGVFVGGDQSYGRANGYPWTTAASGTTANTFVQQVGPYDIAILNGSTEGWDSNGTYDRENMTQALLKNTTYSIKLSQTRRCLPFFYQMMMSGVATGSPYQQYFTLVQANNWWLYESTGGTGTITPAGGGANLVNYSAAWPNAIGSAGVGQSICGTNYGTTSSGSPTGVQGPARTMGNYVALKYLIRNNGGIDARFSFNPQNASPSCGGVFLDNCFVALDGSGSVPNSSLDGITIAPGSQQGGGFPGLDTVQPVMARGNRNMFDQMQTMASTYQAGSTFYNFANFGQYANAYQFGKSQLAGAGLDNLQGGLLENALGAGGSSWEYYQTGNPNTGGSYVSGWPNLRDNYYAGMDFCLAPKLVGLGTRLPTTDGNHAASWAVNGTLTNITAGSALEFQLMRYGLCTALLDDGYFAPGTISTYDYATLRWYDEYGDDSLTQVNVKRGYLGTPLTTRPTSATWAQGPLGVWSRSFTNGMAIVNPRGNGAQTVTLSQSMQKLTGTQQPTINNGAVVSSVTLADGDGIILINNTGFYPAGHWQAAKAPMRLIYPQPDGVPSASARHHKAYYDGVNPVQYRIPVGVQYGALPLVFTLLSGPAGMSIGQSYGSTNYGEVVWTPTGPVTNATVSVQIQDQAGASITVTWTVSTSSSTSDFIFVSPSGNDSTGTGSITAPFQTLNKVYGATAAASTYPNANLYLRAGTYTTYDQGSGYGIQLQGGANPIAIMGFPGESVTLNINAAGNVSAFNTNGSGGSDLFLQNFTFSGGPSASGNFRHCYLGQLQHRQTFHNIAAPSVWCGTSPSDNSTMFYFNAPGGSSYRNYIYIKGCSETNRVSGNSFGITSMFVAQYVLLENNSCTNSAGQTNYFLKASCADCTVRYNFASGNGGSPYPMGDGCQNDGLASQNYEYAYNTIVNPLGNAALSMNIQASTCGTHWAYRNTIYGCINVETPTGNGPFTMENNAQQYASSGQPVQINYANSSLPSNVTNTGTECQATSGVLDASYKLTGTYRTNYLGLRGAEIA